MHYLPYFSLTKAFNIENEDGYKKDPHTYKPPTKKNMSRHQFDLIMCLKQPGVQTGLLCEKCDGKCPICDSYVRPKRKVRVCENCSFGKQAKNCIICNLNVGVNDAFYCWECCRLGKDKDGCPRILNLGSNRLDRHFEKKKKV